MRLNDLEPALASKAQRKRVGRGAGSGTGKTAGRGTKGQNARSGGGVRPGFEGGQLPIQVRLPKFGFRSRKALRTAEVRLGELNKLEGDVLSLNSLREAGLISSKVTRVRIMKSGELKKAVRADQAALDNQTLHLTKGARLAVEALNKRAGQADSIKEEDAQ